MAAVRATRVIVGYDVVPVTGGFVVRRRCGDRIDFRGRGDYWLEAAGHTQPLRTADGARWIIENIKAKENRR